MIRVLVFTTVFLGIAKVASNSCSSLDGKGELLPGDWRDGLHLEEKGYDVWPAALEPIFAEFLGPPAEMD
jgi:hypothetical protein